MTDAMVELDGIGVRFGVFQALDEVSFTVGRGEVVGLVGPNGSGKSTALRTVTGLLAPQSGSVVVGGHRAGSVPARRLIGLVPDDPSGLGLLTVGEYLDLVAALWERPEGFAARCEAALGLFGLGHRRADRMESLSNGTRRIVSMVAVVGLDPDVVVVDEATASLDPEAVVVLRELLARSARHGSAVLVATQHLSFAEAVCDRVVLLGAGHVVADGAPAALCRQFDVACLEEVFLAVTFGSGRLEEVRRVLDAL